MKKKTDQKVMTYHTMTMHGASTLAQTMKTKYGCTILDEKATQQKNGTWAFRFTEPELLSRKF